MKIGLALSGGGVRATVFHLGVLGRLAQQSLLENISFLSTVSGGTLAVALARACSDNNWPNSIDYLNNSIAKSRVLLTERSLKWSYVMHALFTPWNLYQGRANVLAAALQKCWSVNGSLTDLPDHPRWVINATCYQTGKNWRFLKKRMGDYVSGYVASPQISLARAAATSAAFPGLVGSLKLDTRKFDWFAYDNTGAEQPHRPVFRKLKIWDGGVYENLGVEPLFKPSGGYREGVDFLIVSDASAELGLEPPSWRAFLRLIKITTDQIRGLRARSVVSHLQQNPGTGAYLRIGNTEEKIYREADRTNIVDSISDNSLDVFEIREAIGVGTTLRKLKKREYDLLFKHGYQVADATLSAYCKETFQPIQLSATGLSSSFSSN